MRKHTHSYLWLVHLAVILKSLELGHQLVQHILPEAEEVQRDVNLLERQLRRAWWGQVRCTYHTNKHMYVHTYMHT